MITPRPEDVEKFRAFDEAAFEQWLRTGLEGYYLDQIGVTNFEPLAYCLLREHTIAGDLRIIYAAFSMRQQGLFRDALANLLSHLPAEARYFPVFRVILELAPSIRAYGILRAIPARAEGFLSIDSEGSGTGALYDQTLEAAFELADQTTTAKTCVERLIGTPGAFDFRYAPKALLILCRIAPDEFAAHIALMREPLAKNFATYKPSADALRWLAHDVLKAVGLPIVESAWPKLRLIDGSTVGEPTDQWLHDALMRMLRREQSGDVFIIVSREQPDVRAKAATLAPMPANDPGVPIIPRLDLPSDELAAQEKADNHDLLDILLGSGRTTEDSAPHDLLEGVST